MAKITALLIAASVLVRSIVLLFRIAASDIGVKLAI